MVLHAVDRRFAEAWPIFRLLCQEAAGSRSKNVNLADNTRYQSLAKKTRLAWACSASWLLRMLHRVMLPHGQNAGQGYDGCFSDPATHITPANRTVMTEPAMC